jgi:hypothetical protein
VRNSNADFSAVLPGDRQHGGTEGIGDEVPQREAVRRRQRFRGGMLAVVVVAKGQGRRQVTFLRNVLSAVYYFGTVQGTCKFVPAGILPGRLLQRDLGSPRR